MSESSKSISILKWLLRFLLPVIVLAGAAGLSWYIISKRPEAKRQPQAPSILNVQAIRAEAHDYRVTIDSRGTVQPRTGSTLIPEVSGRVVAVSPSFRDGGFFEKDDTLLQIDPRDYEAAVVTAKATLEQARLAVVQEQVNAQSAKTAVTIAESALAAEKLRLREAELQAQATQAAVATAASELAQTKLSLAEEQARSDQALRDWKRLERSDEPGELVLRKPQMRAAEAKMQAAEASLKQRQQDVDLIQPRIDSARANVKAAEAQLAQRQRDLDLVEPRVTAAKAAVEARMAELEQRRHNLQRTTIQAPYAGRVLDQRVDIGQYVSTGTVLADIYAIDIAEIRLPITNRQLAFVDLPTHFRGDAQKDGGGGTPVTLIGSLGETTYHWEGRIVQTEGAIDVESRQIFAVAQVMDPYGRSEADRPPLKVGMFVRAQIEGKLLENQVVIPRGAVRQGNQVYVISEANLVTRRTVTVVWTDDASAVVAEGLKPGEIICLTPITFAGDSVKVNPTVVGESPAIKEQP